MFQNLTKFRRRFKPRGNIRKTLSSRETTVPLACTLSNTSTSYPPILQATDMSPEQSLSASSTSSVQMPVPCPTTAFESDADDLICNIAYVAELVQAGPPVGSHLERTLDKQGEHRSFYVLTSNNQIILMQVIKWTISLTIWMR